MVPKLRLVAPMELSSTHLPVMGVSEMTNTRTVKRGKKNCPHYETITIRIATIATLNVGLERVVCQTCGHVAVHPIDDLSSHEAATASPHPIQAANTRQTTSV